MDNNVKENFIVALANMSSCKYSGNNTSSITVPPSAKYSTEIPLAQPEYAIETINSILQHNHLENYDLILCWHLHDNEYCGYNVLLVKLTSHYFTLPGNLSVINYICHLYTVALLRYLVVNTINPQINAIHTDILQVFPNIILTDAELQVLWPLTN